MKMTHYSGEPYDTIFIKSYGFLSFAKNIRLIRLKEENYWWSKINII